MQVRRPTSTSLVVTSSMVMARILYVALYMALPLWLVWPILKESEIQSIHDIQSVAILLGIVLVISAFGYFKMRGPTIVSTFDNQLNSLTLEKNWFWKSKTETVQYSNIKNIHVVQKGKFGKARRYFRVEIELLNQDRIRLSSANYRPKEGVERAADQIMEFLWPGSSFYPAAKIDGIKPRLLPK